MSQINKKSSKVVRERTHGGAPATRVRVDAVQKLRRSVLSTLLWEDQFYEDGQSIADRIAELSAQVSPAELYSLAVEARSVHNLRHIPLQLTVNLVRHPDTRARMLVADTVQNVVQRADELTELLSLYWKDGKTPLSNQLKKGLAAAFTKFSPYQLAKYNRDNAIKLRDVMFMVHPKPKDKAQEVTFNQLASNTLESPDTWEVALSGGADKRETFTRLLTDGKLGYMALLRNLRNMQESGVDPRLVTAALLREDTGRDKVLPFRFVAAGRAAPQYISALDSALLSIKEKKEKLPGHTIILVDVSGSMNGLLSARSDLTRMDAACALASLINCESHEVWSFSNRTVQVTGAHGIEGATRIRTSQVNGYTELAAAVASMNQRQHDRIIVITDEQSTSYSPVPDPVAEKAYMINVASYRNGVGYGKWTHIDGFSEGVLRWIEEYEKL